MCSLVCCIAGSLYPLYPNLFRKSSKNLWKNSNKHAIIKSDFVVWTSFHWEWSGCHCLASWQMVTLTFFIQHFLFCSIVCKMFGLCQQLLWLHGWARTTYILTCACTPYSSRCLLTVLPRISIRALIFYMASKPRRLNKTGCLFEARRLFLIVYFEGMVNLRRSLIAAHLHSLWALRPGDLWPR